MKQETILIGRDAYIYLDRESRKQRGCNALTIDQYLRRWNRASKDANGLHVTYNFSFGGGDGTYDGKWWDWSVNTLKEMLDKAGYSWEQGPSIDCTYM